MEINKIKQYLYKFVKKIKNNTWMVFFFFYFKGMKLILVSDCYIGFEQEYSLEDLIERQH